MSGSPRSFCSILAAAALAMAGMAAVSSPIAAAGISNANSDGTGNVSSNVVYLSSNSGGRAGAVVFADEDIVGWDSGSGNWIMFFDGSAAGLPRSADLNGFAIVDDDNPDGSELLLTFQNPTVIPDLGRVDDSDVVIYDQAAAAFTGLALDGSTVGLSTSGEDIDAIAVVDGALVLSTVANAVVPASGSGTLRARDEDLLRFDAANGRFSLHFDGSDVGLAGEDISGAFIDGATGAAHLATLRGFRVPGLRGDKDDVARFAGTYGPTTSGSFELFFDGDDNGFANEQIDGLAVAPSSEPPPPPPPPPDSFGRCLHPTGGDEQLVDFMALKDSGLEVSELNESGNPTFLRTVFELDSDRMRWGDQGLELSFDVGIAGPLNYEYRAELREKTINQPIPAGTTQMYCMRFRVDALPDLYGPVEVFQRFDRAVDGPDLGVELTGANQFSNAVPNDIQVVNEFDDGRYRTGHMLEEFNTMLVVIYNHRSNGAYKVVLNHQVLEARSGLDTTGSPGGTWSQFGLYPHGLYENPNRADQIASGRTSAQFEYIDFELVDFPAGSSNLAPFTVEMD